MRLPKSWKDISLEQFKELHALGQREDLDPLDRMLQTLSVATLTNIEELESLPVAQLESLYRRMRFLSTYPSTKYPSKVIIEGQRFRLVTNPRNISAGEFATLQHLLDGDLIANLPNIMAALMVRQQRTFWGWKDVRFDKVKAAEDYHWKAARAGKGLNVSQAYPYALFFSALYLKSLEATRNYLAAKVQELQQLT